MPSFMSSSYSGSYRNEWGHARTITIGESAPTDVTSTSVSISARFGGLLGRLRTDVEKPIVRSIKFQVDRRGSGDFEIVLSEIPEFDIPPFSIVQFKIGNTTYGWHMGFVTQVEKPGTTPRDDYVIRGHGLRDQLESVSAEQNISAVTDVGQIVSDLVQNYIVPNTDIGYDSSKITTSTGVLTAQDIELGKQSISEVLDALAAMANYRWGVNGDGNLFFEPAPSTNNRTYFVGFDCEEFELVEDIESVRNSIKVKRQQSKASSDAAAGWVIGAIREDASSQAKFGVREYEFTAPGYWTDDDCGTLADSILASKKDPPNTGRCRSYLVQDSDDFVPVSIHRWVFGVDNYDSQINSCDDSTDFTITASGDLAIADEASIIAEGAGASKLTWTSANGDTAVLQSLSFAGAHRVLKFWIRGNRAGAYLTVGIGETVFTEHTRLIAIPVANQYFVFEWDVSGLGLTTIGQVGFRVDDTSGTSTTVYLDHIRMAQRDFKHVNFDVQKIDYHVLSRKIYADIEYGEMPPKLENYVKVLQAQAQESKWISESRTGT